MLTVVKVGGGLGAGAGDDALRALCATLGELGERHPLLVVPGGAWFADAVREADRRFALPATTSHHMAILGMEQFGWLLSELIPGAERCAEPARAPAGRTLVVLPAALALDSLPASWEVTSDSIAAWVAGKAGAGRLVLVKEVDGVYAEWPARGDPIARMTAAELAALRPAGVDEHLPTLLEAATLRDVGDQRARPRSPRRAARTGDDGGHASRLSALATVAPWMRSSARAPRVPRWPTPRCGSTSSSAGWRPSPTAASGPASSPGSRPASSGMRRPSTWAPTSARGRSCPDERRQRLTTILAGFRVAEDAVAENLTPFVVAANRETLASQESLMAWTFSLQRRDEARHARLFDRIAGELLGLPGETPDERRAAAREYAPPAILELFEEQLPALTAELTAGEAGLGEGVSLYHMLLEGVVFNAGTNALLDGPGRRRTARSARGCGADRARRALARRLRPALPDRDPALSRAHR